VYLLSNSGLFGSGEFAGGWFWGVREKTSGHNQTLCGVFDSAYPSISLTPSPLFLPQLILHLDAGYKVFICETCQSAFSMCISPDGDPLTETQLAEILRKHAYNKHNPFASSLPADQKKWSSDLRSFLGAAT
jgi:hypothetical protein